MKKTGPGDLIEAVWWIGIEICRRLENINKQPPIYVIYNPEYPLDPEQAEKLRKELKGLL